MSAQDQPRLVVVPGAYDGVDDGAYHGGAHGAYHGGDRASRRECRNGSAGRVILGGRVADIYSRNGRCFADA